MKKRLKKPTKFPPSFFVSHCQTSLLDRSGRTQPKQSATMASTLTTIPRYVFCIIEPVALILAFTTTAVSPAYYVAGQSKLTPPANLAPSETILTYQMSNLFLLIAIIELYVFHSTNDINVAHALLTALWWGDLGHLGVTVWCMGWATLRNVGDWSLVNWGNLTIPLFLFVMRSFYLFGGLETEEKAKREKHS